MHVFRRLNWTSRNRQRCDVSDSARSTPYVLVGSNTDVLRGRSEVGCARVVWLACLPKVELKTNPRDTASIAWIFRKYMIRFPSPLISVFQSHHLLPTLRISVSCCTRPTHFSSLRSVSTMAKLDLNIPDLTLPDGNKIPFVGSHPYSATCWNHTNSGW